MHHHTQRQLARTGRAARLLRATALVALSAPLAAILATGPAEATTADATTTTTTTVAATTLTLDDLVQAGLVLPAPIPTPLNWGWE